MSPQRRFEVDLLVFDLDGTLIDTRQDLADAVNFALRQLGKEPLSLEEVTGLVGDGVRTLLARVLAGESETILAEALVFFRQFYGEHLADHSRFYPRMRDVLLHFRGKKKAVLSNKPQEFARALLDKLDSLPVFDVVIGGHPSRPLKPDPQALQDILTRLATPPVRAVMIGDGENDILAGKAAGLMTCATSYGFRSAQKLLALRPDFVAHAPEDLMNIFT
jgi:phosphoglycolate phosphatase